MAFGAAARTCHRCGPTRQVRIQRRRTMSRICIVQGPVGADTVTALQLQVGRQETERRAEPMPSGPADQPQISAAKRVRPILSEVSILYCGRALGIGGHLIRRLRHPDGRTFESLQGHAAINVRASLNDGHPRPGIGQAPRHQCTGNASAHDQYVALLGQKTLVRYWKARKPSFQDRRCKNSAVGPFRPLATSKWCQNFAFRTIHPA